MEVFVYHVFAIGITLEGVTIYATYTYGAESLISSVATVSKMTNDIRNSISTKRSLSWLGVVNFQFLEKIDRPYTNQVISFREVQ